jgi:hypothetical protein
MSLQSPKSAMQAPIAHAPPVQVGVALGTSQAVHVVAPQPYMGSSMATQAPLQSFCAAVQAPPSPPPVPVAPLLPLLDAAPPVPVAPLLLLLDDDVVPVAPLPLLDVAPPVPPPLLDAAPPVAPLLLLDAAPPVPPVAPVLVDVAPPVLAPPPAPGIRERSTDARSSQPVEVETNRTASSAYTTNSTPLRMRMRLLLSVRRRG